jgi:hypothetical protein
METTIATSAPANHATDHHNEAVSVMLFETLQKPCPFTRHSGCKPIENEVSSRTDGELTSDKICHRQSVIR